MMNLYLRFYFYSNVPMLGLLDNDTGNYYFSISKTRERDQTEIMEIVKKVCVLLLHWINETIFLEGEGD